MSKYTLVLNNNYIPLGIVSSRNAFVNVFTDNVDLVSNYDSPKLHSAHAEWDIPSVIRARKFVKLPFTKSTLTKENIFKRDGHKCVYCGVEDGRNLTIDHILPKCRGGKNKWENLVASCYSCNNLKGNKTPEEMGWERPVARHPHYLVLMSSFVKEVPESWKAYLFM